MEDAGYKILDAGYWMLDTGCRIVGNNNSFNLSTLPNLFMYLTRKMKFYIRVILYFGI
jgi:hypothetical protein